MKIFVTVELLDRQRPFEISILIPRSPKSLCNLFIPVLSLHVILEFSLSFIPSIMCLSRYSVKSESFKITRYSLINLRSWFLNETSENLSVSIKIDILGASADKVIHPKYECSEKLCYFILYATFHQSLISLHSCHAGESDLTHPGVPSKFHDSSGYQPRLRRPIWMDFRSRRPASIGTVTRRRCNF